MKVDIEGFRNINKPMYLLEERLLRKNLSLIKHVADTAGVEIILAFKAYALWKTFPNTSKPLRQALSQRQDWLLTSSAVLPIHIHPHTPLMK